MNIQISKFVEGLQLISFLLGLVTAMVLPEKLISGQEINSGGLACTAIAIFSVLLAALIERRINLIFVTFFQILLFACPIYALLILIEIANVGFNYLFFRSVSISIVLICITIFSIYMYRWLEPPKKA